MTSYRIVPRRVNGELFWRCYKSGYNLVPVFVSQSLEMVIDWVYGKGVSKYES